MNILVIGQSGSGKSTSIRTLPPKETFIYQVIDKPLPFKNADKLFPLLTEKNKDGNRKIIYGVDFLENPSKEAYADVSQKLILSMRNLVKVRPHVKYIVIDDSQYLMAYEYMFRAKERGYDKFVEIQQNFFNVVTAASMLSDKFIFFLHHSENGENSLRKAKTIGKMIDSTITLEGVFTIVLEAMSRRNNGKIEYFFKTNNDGTSTAKSPEGMFPEEIPNDLKVVVDGITKYYGG